MRRRLSALLIRAASWLDAEEDLYLVRNTRGTPNGPNSHRAGVVEPFLTARGTGLPIAATKRYLRGMTDEELVRVPRGLKVHVFATPEGGGPRKSVQAR